MFQSLLTLLGGISVFLYGLKTISQGTQSFISKTKTQTLTNFVKRPVNGVFLGMVVAGVTQSSVAVSFITVGLVELNVISFNVSAPIIMGANVGTTITAQLVSLSGGEGVIIGSFASIIGLLTGFSKNNKLKNIGESLMGLGLIFAGLTIMNGAIVSLVFYGWFKSLFLIENPIVLFLNGVVTTAVVQSSSAITGIMVLLAGNGMVGFKSAVFLTLGANVGSCFSVIFASLNKSVQAKRASLFNFCFNLLGSLIFFPIMLVFGDEFATIFMANNLDVGRAIANFHTIFNLSCVVLFMPFYRTLTNLIAKFVCDQPKMKKRNTFYKTFTSKSRRFN
ncbi:MAG: Na/Pi cotransporter family protein [Clostridia bacterium]|nr:Na/Pi cotransporter family protein [Clostridia bacterium]